MYTAVCQRSERRRTNGRQECKIDTIRFALLAQDERLVSRARSKTKEGKTAPRRGRERNNNSHGLLFWQRSRPTICFFEQKPFHPGPGPFAGNTESSSLLLLVAAAAAAVPSYLRLSSTTPDPTRWHDSMYYEGSYFWQLFHDTQVYTRRATSIYCGPPARYVRPMMCLLCLTVTGR